MAVFDNPFGVLNIGPRGTVDRVLIVGDWHANSKWVEKKMHVFAKNLKVDAIVQVGDFGYGFTSGYLKTVSDLAISLDAPVLWIDGNHEHFPELYKVEVQSNGLRAVAEGVYHVPRGTAWSWGGYTWLGLGGAYSIDRNHRELGRSYWEEEVLTEEDVEKALSVGKVDVLISHDTGSNHVIPGIAASAPFWHPYHLEQAEKHRETLQRVLDGTRPEVNYHGHYHVSYEATNGPTRVVGLDMDGAARRHHMRVVDVHTLEEKLLEW